MIKLQLKSLDEVAEFLRPFITEAEGVFSMDESKLKTETDVNNVLQAKEHVNNELKLFKALGKSPEEIKALLEALAPICSYFVFNFAKKVLFEFLFLRPSQRTLEILIRIFLCLLSKKTLM